MPPPGRRRRLGALGPRALLRRGAEEGALALGEQFLQKGQFLLRSRERGPAEAGQFVGELVELGVQLRVLAFEEHRDLAQHLGVTDLLDTTHGRHYIIGARLEQILSSPARRRMAPATAPPARPRRCLRGRAAAHSSSAAHGALPSPATGTRSGPVRGAWRRCTSPCRPTARPWRVYAWRSRRGSNPRTADPARAPASPRR